jgi:hypothetical protein
MPWKECTACFAQADLLALDLPRITRHKTRLSQWLAQFLVIHHQSAGQTVTNSASLARRATAGNGHAHIELVH